MFLTMFFKTQNIVQTMHLTMLIAHPYPGVVGADAAQGDMGPGVLMTVSGVQDLGARIHL